MVADSREHPQDLGNKQKLKEKEAQRCLQEKKIGNKTSIFKCM
jgi:hypothetical protein